MSEAERVWGGGGGKISWGGIFGGKQGMWRLGGDLGELEEAVKCSHSGLCIEEGEVHT